MANNTTTQHLEALIVEDGHQFAMVRKADLAALLQACKENPYQGRYIDTLGEVNRVMAEQSQVIDEAFGCIDRMGAAALKHGDERRRYMANNKALLARVAELERRTDSVPCAPGEYLVYFPEQYGVRGRYESCKLSAHGVWTIARNGSPIPEPRVADTGAAPLVCVPIGAGL